MNLDLGEALIVLGIILLFAWPSLRAWQEREHSHQIQIECIAAGANHDAETKSCTFTD